MKYMWNKWKVGRRQHVQGLDGLSWCKCENGGTRLQIISEERHQQKKVCRICLQLISAHDRKSGRKKIRAEQKAEMESENRLGRLQKERTQTYKRDPFLRTREWKQVRYMALERSSGKCECCGRGKESNVILHVDHIKPRYNHPELALTLVNLQVLCADCNQGKGGKYETDWRTPRLRVIMGEEMA